VIARVSYRRSRGVREVGLGPAVPDDAWLCHGPDRTRAVLSLARPLRGSKVIPLLGRNTWATGEARLWGEPTVTRRNDAALPWRHLSPAGREASEGTMTTQRGYQPCQDSGHELIAGAQGRLQLRPSRPARSERSSRTRCRRWLRFAGFRTCRGLADLRPLGLSGFRMALGLSKSGSCRTSSDFMGS
jgi:hypothetical protein